MLEQIKILSSRRAYEFRQDGLRLSVLSTRPVQQQFQELFRFQTSAMGTPSPTFGDVPTTYPPGFVFDMGVWISPDQQLVPIRFLHFEQRRIVIDVAGPSSVITAIFERVREFFSELHAPDGAPIIGEPERILDYSEITARFPFALDALISEPFRTLLKSVLPDSSDSSNELIPTFSAQVYPIDRELANVPSLNDVRALSFALRAGTHPHERIYFSGAPFDSETHLHYLEQLETLLNSRD
jgi:hypothetical protein